jgi:phthiocerol/phenolphthiocerol synthesis type-I polyketide synthase E
MKQVAMRPPRIPYLSNVTGHWISASEATDPQYWVDQLRNTVRFSDCVTELLREPGRVMIEIGPGQTLASLVRQHASKTPGEPSAGIFYSVRRRDEAALDTATLLQALGQVWITGHAVDWSALHQAKRRDRSA